MTADGASSLSSESGFTGPSKGPTVGCLLWSKHEHVTAGDGPTNFHGANDGISCLHTATFKCHTYLHEFDCCVQLFKQLPHLSKTSSFADSSVGYLERNTQNASLQPEKSHRTALRKESTDPIKQLALLCFSRGTGWDPRNSGVQEFCMPPRGLQRPPGACRGYTRTYLSCPGNLCLSFLFRVSLKSPQTLWTFGK